MAATALACTEQLGVGIGLLPAVTRNVATAAMEIAALARIAPGRLVVGLGHGIPEWMAQIGAPSGARTAALEEFAPGLAGAARRGEVTVEGERVWLDGLKLGFPPAEVPPILLGTTGPRGLRAAGRSADGAVLPEIGTAAAIRWARAEMAAGGTAGTTVVFAMASVDEDRAAALAEVRPRMQRLVDFGVFPHLMAHGGARRRRARPTRRWGAGLGRHARGLRGRGGRALRRGRRPGRPRRRCRRSPPQLRDLRRRVPASDQFTDALGESMLGNIGPLEIGIVLVIALLVFGRNACRIWAARSAAGSASSATASKGRAARPRSPRRGAETEAAPVGVDEPR